MLGPLPALAMTEITWQYIALKPSRPLPTTMSPPPTYILSDPEKRREWIKQALRDRGSSMAQVARDHGVTRDAATLAMKKPYPRMERAIARALNLEPQQLWPERYDHQGRPNRPIGRPKKSISK